MRRSSVWLVVMVSGSLLGACGDDDDKKSGKNICEQACDKVETCPSMQCVLNLDNCDAATRQIAECVLATPCDQLASCLP